MNTPKTLLALSLAFAAASPLLAGSEEVPVIFIQPGTMVKISSAKEFSSSLRPAIEKNKVSVGMAQDPVEGGFGKGFGRIATATGHSAAIGGDFDGIADKPTSRASGSKAAGRKYEPIRKVRLGFFHQDKKAGKNVKPRIFSATLYSLQFAEKGMSTTTGDREIHAIHVEDADSLVQLYSILGTIARGRYSVYVYEDQPLKSTSSTDSASTFPGSTATQSATPFGIQLPVSS